MKVAVDMNLKIAKRDITAAYSKFGMTNKRGPY